MQMSNVVQFASQFLVSCWLGPFKRVKQPYSSPAAAFFVGPTKRHVFASLSNN